MIITLLLYTAQKKDPVKRLFSKRGGKIQQYVFIFFWGMGGGGGGLLNVSAHRSQDFYLIHF